MEPMREETEIEAIEMFQRVKDLVPYGSYDFHSFRSGFGYGTEAALKAPATSLITDVVHEVVSEEMGGFQPITTKDVFALGAMLAAYRVRSQNV